MKDNFGVVNKIELGKRLLEIRKDLKISVSREFATAIGADPSYYAKAEKGGGLSDEYLNIIADRYQYNKAWLWFGEGSPKGGVKTPEYKTPDETISVANEDGRYHADASSTALSEILAINKVYADAHKVFADAHKRAIDTNALLAELVKNKNVTEHDLQESLIGATATLRVLQEFVLQDGVGKHWKSVHEGAAILGRQIAEVVQNSKAVDTRAGARR